MNKKFFLSLSAVLALSQFGLAQDPAQPPKTTTPPVQPPVNQDRHADTNLPAADGAIAPAAKASAQLESKSGSKVTGNVDFAETGTGIRIHYTIKGLSKDKVYGMHIHEKGDCSSPDAKSAGKHYMQVAPSGGTSLDNPQKYAGDLPSVKADAHGEASGTVVATGLTIHQKNAIANHAVILHDGPDDVTKKSAARIACGVIK